LVIVFLRSIDVARQLAFQPMRGSRPLIAIKYSRLHQNAAGRAISAIAETRFDIGQRRQRIAE
jgi:hypothetical protein